MSSEVKRNCNSCKHSLFGRCETLKNNKEYQELAKEDNLLNPVKFEFKEKYICDDYKSMYIEYPIEVSKINTKCEKGSYRDSYIGKFTKIKPCGEEYKGKTFLGIYIGDLPISINISHNSDTKELNVSFRNNPAIFVFELNKIVYGCESWWRIIKNEEELKEITDIDIDNIWYVKALKELSK